MCVCVTDQFAICLRLTQYCKSNVFQFKKIPPKLFPIIVFNKYLFRKTTFTVGQLWACSATDNTVSGIFQGTIRQAKWWEFSGVRLWKGSRGVVLLPVAAWLHQERGLGCLGSLRAGMRNATRASCNTTKVTDLIETQWSLLSSLTSLGKSFWTICNVLGPTPVPHLTVGNQWHFFPCPYTYKHLEWGERQSPSPDAPFPWTLFVHILSFHTMNIRTPRNFAL